MRMKILTTVAILLTGLAPLPASSQVSSKQAGPAVKIVAAPVLSYYSRATKIIGHRVENGQGQVLGTIDDLILSKNDKVLYVILSVGGFLGVGDRLVAVRFDAIEQQGDELRLPHVMRKDLEALPEFHYAKDDGGESLTKRKNFERSTARKVAQWRAKLVEHRKHASEESARLKSEAAQRVNVAWQKVEQEWKELKSASEDDWEKARRSFERTWGKLERAWEDQKPPRKKTR